MRGLVVAIVAALAAAACGGSDVADDEDTIAIFGPYGGRDADRWIEVVEAYAEPRGLPVRYIGSQDFVTDLQQRTGSGNDPPDIAIVPQPGLVEELVAAGAILPLGEEAIAGLEANYPERVRDLVTTGGVAHGVPFRLTMKSLVWYRPSVFEDNGWTVPATMDELAELVSTIENSDGGAGADSDTDGDADDDDDVAAWCLGLEAGTATGWPATDWVEDLVVRGSGDEVYRRWAAGEVPFADPRIEEAFDEFRELVLADGRVVGGLIGVVETPVDEAVEPLFDDEGGCAMYKQADFAVQWMPSGTEVGPDGDVDWFVLPGTTASQPPPVVVGGDQVVQFRSTPEIDELMAYLAGPDAGRSWAEAGGFLSPKSTIGPEDYGDESDAELDRLLSTDPLLVFDASDQMPVEVGSDLLWSMITQWVSGALPYDIFAEIVDESLREARASLAAAIGSVGGDR